MMLARKEITLRLDKRLIYINHKNQCTNVHCHKYDTLYDSALKTQTMEGVNLTILGDNREF